MLDARDHLVGRRVVGALRRLDARSGEDRAEVGILARALGDAAPARIVRDIDHRAVDLLDADRRRLAGGDGVVGGRDRRVEAARGPERHREDRPVAVDRVVCEQDRDVQARLLHGDVLQRVDLGGIGQAEDAADALLRHVGKDVPLCIRDLAVGEQLELLQLVGQRHLAEQALDLPLDLLVAGEVPRRLQRLLVGRSRGGADGAHHEQSEGRDRSTDRETTSSSTDHASSSLVSAATLLRPEGLPVREDVKRRRRTASSRARPSRSRSRS